MIWPLVYLGEVPALVAAASSAKRKVWEGCHTLRKRARAKRETREAAMAGSSGPIKLAVAHMVRPKDPPETKMAGRVSFTPFRPDMARTTQKGTIKARSPNWNPAAWLMANGYKPAVLAAVMTGIPIAPKATGAVLAIIHRPAA